MAVIPTATARRTLDTGRGTIPNVRISDAPGRALQSLGASIQAFSQRAEQQQSQLSGFKAQTGFVDLQGEADKLLRESQANLLPGAEGFHDNTVLKFDELSTNFLGTITDPKVRQKAELQVQRLRNRFSNRAANTELEERNRFFDSELNRVGEGFLGAVDSNPSGIANAINNFTVAVEDSGLSPVQKQTKIQAFREQAIERALQSIGKSNPALAKRVMNQIRRLQAKRFGGEAKVSADINASLPDTLVKSKDRFVPGRGKLARGIRNNNPGNIEFGKFTRARGAIGSDGRFAKFSSPEEGISAMASLLRSYQRRGLNTISKMISRYAPASENDTKAYAAAVSRAVGITADTPFDISARPDLASRMVAAMILHENGRQPYNADQITQGVANGLGVDVPDNVFAKRAGGQKVKGTQVAVATPNVFIPSIDVFKPKIENPDGSFSTERTITIRREDGKFVNIPTIINGKQVSESEAQKLFREGKNPAVSAAFDDVQDAVKAAKARSDAIGRLRRRPKVPNQVDPKVVQFTQVSGPRSITTEDAPEGETLLSGERISTDPSVVSGEEDTLLEDLDEETIEALLDEVAAVPNLDQIPDNEVASKSEAEPAQFLDEAIEAAVQVPDVELPQEVRPVLRAAATGTAVIGAESFSRVESVISKAQKAVTDAEDDFEKERGDVAFKELLSLSVRDQLTIEQVEANKDILSTTQFSQLLKAANRQSDPPSKSDPTVFADLMVRADEDPEGVQRDALQAFSQGLLTQEDFTKFFTITRSVERKRPPWFKSVKDFVRFSLKPPDPIFDLDGSLARKQQQAVLDFEEFFLENPDVSFDDARKRAEELVKQSGSANVSDAASTKEVPAFIEGTPTVEKLNAARDKIQSMLDTGQITEEEALQQGRLIMQWMNTLKAE